jgi:hypothetical protein
MIRDNLLDNSLPPAFWRTNELALRIQQALERRAVPAIEPGPIFFLEISFADSLCA